MSRGPSCVQGALPCVQGPQNCCRSRGNTLSIPRSYCVLGPAWPHGDVALGTYGGDEDATVWTQTFQLRKSM